MSGTGRYWIFFVIVAVGLALSWGQVGRKAERVLHDEQVTYLHTETPCRPLEAPCAAVAGDRALVLGPLGDGLGLRQAGLAGNAILGVEATYLARDGAELAHHAVTATGDPWRLPTVPDGARLVQIRVSANGGHTVGEFPL